MLVLYADRPAVYAGVNTCAAMQDTIKFFFRGGSYTLADILPQRFGPANLLADLNAPLLLQPQHHDLTLTAGNPHL